jgi:hypothetical protein
MQHADAACCCSHLQQQLLLLLADFAQHPGRWQAAAAWPPRPGTASAWRHQHLQVRGVQVRGVQVRGVQVRGVQAAVW